PRACCQSRWNTVERSNSAAPVYRRPLTLGVNRAERRLNYACDFPSTSRRLQDLRPPVAKLPPSRIACSGFPLRLAASDVRSRSTRASYLAERRYQWIPWFGAMPSCARWPLRPRVMLCSGGGASYPVTRLSHAFSPP